jgi:N-acetylglutamate synthase-like GNAT family acetyltransferase
MLVDLFDSDGLAGEDLAEVDFLAVETDAAAGGDGDRLVVEWIVQVRQTDMTPNS